jgi:hypothetical protein
MLFVEICNQTGKDTIMDSNKRKELLQKMGLKCSDMAKASTALSVKPILNPSPDFDDWFSPEDMAKELQRLSGRTLDEETLSQLKDAAGTFLEDFTDIAVERLGCNAHFYRLKPEVFRMSGNSFLNS